MEFAWGDRGRGPGRGREGEGVQTLKVMVLVFGRSTLHQDNAGYGHCMKGDEGKQRNIGSEDPCNPETSQQPGKDGPFWGSC